VPKHPFLPATLAFFATSLPLSAGEPPRIQGAELRYDQEPAPPPSVFGRGKIELSAIEQAYWSISFTDGTPSLDFSLHGLRLGMMLADPHGTGKWRRNAELILEVLYANVTEGPGDWMAGGNIILRRNFIGEDERVAWYLQAGAGLVANDIYKDWSQSLIGRDLEFSLLAGAGVRIQLSENWHAFAEVNYRHFSNADTRERNTGLDALGVGLGVGFSF
jgi:hypothetical protein